MTFRMRAFERRQGDSATVDAFRLHAPGGKHFRQDAAVRVVVVDHQNGQVLYKFGIAEGFGLWDAIRESEVTRKVERASAADFAFDPDSSAHQRDEPGGDGQPEARAAVSARGGGVRLRERVENHLLFVSRNSDAGIAHLKMQYQPA